MPSQRLLIKVKDSCPLLWYSELVALPIVQVTAAVCRRRDYGGIIHVRGIVNRIKAPGTPSPARMINLNLASALVKGEQP